MNTKENQKMRINKVHENLLLRGRSEKTYIKYRCRLKSFFKYFNQNTNIQELREEQIIQFLNDKFIKTNRCKATYNVAVCSIRLLYLVCFNVSLNRLLT